MSHGIAPIKEHVRLTVLIFGKIPERDKLANYSVSAGRMYEEEIITVALMLVKQWLGIDHVKAGSIPLLPYLMSFISLEVEDHIIIHGIGTAASQYAADRALFVHRMIDTDFAAVLEMEHIGYKSVSPFIIYRVLFSGMP